MAVQNSDKESSQQSYFGATKAISPTSISTAAWACRKLFPTSMGAV
jgi:hypothetical protein